MIYEKQHVSLGLAIFFEDSFTGKLPLGNVKFNLEGNVEEKLIKKNNGMLLFLKQIPNVSFKIIVKSEFYHDVVISFIDSKFTDSIGYNVGEINSQTNVAGPIKLIPKPNYPFTSSDFILRGMLSSIQKNTIYKIGIDKFSCYSIATQTGEFVLPLDVTSEHLVHFIISFINNDQDFNFELTITEYIQQSNVFESDVVLNHPVTVSKIGHINLGKIEVEK